MSRKSLILVILTLLQACHIQAQKERTTLFGMGWSNEYDTYLSPLEYKGTGLTVLNSRMHEIRKNSNVVFRGTWALDLSYTKNHAKTAHNMGGRTAYQASWMRQWKDVAWHGLTLMGGGMLGGDVGFLYNTRNGNNPAQAYMGIQAGISGMARQHFHMGKRDCHADYQIYFPLAGAMFSPDYRQSYYELFYLKNYNHNIVFTHPGNALSMMQTVTISIPLRKRTLTMGYRSCLLQAKPNNLRQHHYYRSILLGFTI